MEHVCIKKTVMSDQQLYTSKEVSLVTDYWYIYTPVVVVKYCISILDTAADVTEGDTSQDVLTSYPHTIPSGMCIHCI